MNRADAQRILDTGGLTHYKFFDSEADSNEVSIVESDGSWFVYKTNERAGRDFTEEFDDESDALEFFIKRVRQVNFIRATLGEEDA